MKSCERNVDSAWPVGTIFMRYIILLILLTPATLTAGTFDTFKHHAVTYCLFDPGMLRAHALADGETDHPPEHTAKPAQVDADGNPVVYGTGYQREKKSGLLLTPSGALSVTPSSEVFFWAGLGMESAIYGAFGVQGRLEFGFAENIDSDQSKFRRDEQVWAIALDIGPSFRWPISDFVRLNVAGGPSVVYATRTDSPGTSSMIGGYVAFGADFGTFNFSGFIETGVRAGVTISSSDADLRDAMTFQWQIVRVGIRLYID